MTDGQPGSDPRDDLPEAVTPDPEPLDYAASADQPDEQQAPEPQVEPQTAEQEVPDWSLAGDAPEESSIESSLTPQPADEAPSAPPAGSGQGAAGETPTTWPPPGPQTPPSGSWPPPAAPPASGPYPGAAAGPSAPGWGATGAPAAPSGIPWPPPPGALPPPGGAPAEGYRPASYPPPGPTGPPAGGPPPMPGAHPYGVAAPRTTDSRAVIGLVCAVLSFVICPVVLAVVGLILAQMSDREIDSSGGRLEGHTLNKATRWVAWINIAVTVLAFVGFLVLFLFLQATGTVIQNDTNF